MTNNKANFSTADALSHVWRTLQASVQLHHHPMRTPVLSVTNTHNEPHACVVVLRKAEPRKLTCYTDCRSQKWLALKANNTLSWTFYDPTEREQIRAVGYATLHHQDATSEAEWNNVPLRSRQNYSSIVAPGHPVDTAGIQHPEQARGFERHYFGIICSTITSIDWLWLGKNSHRRMIWTSEHGGNWVSP